MIKESLAGWAESGASEQLQDSPIAPERCWANEQGRISASASEPGAGQRDSILVWVQLGGEHCGDADGQGHAHGDADALQGAQVIARIGAELAPVDPQHGRTCVLQRARLLQCEAGRHGLDAFGFQCLAVFAESGQVVVQLCDREHHAGGIADHHQTHTGWEPFEHGTSRLARIAGDDEHGDGKLRGAQQGGIDGGLRVLGSWLVEQDRGYGLLHERSPMRASIEVRARGRQAELVIGAGPMHDKRVLMNRVRSHAGWLVGATAALTVLIAMPAVATAPKDPPRAVQPGPNGLIVHFGDSFVDAGLRQSFAPKFATHHTKYFFFGRRMTTLASWASGSELDELYAGFRPSLFLVTLGANDLSYPHPEQRVALVRKIVGKMKGTPCVWLSIPLWKGAPTGMSEMFRRESAPCRYFDSSVVADTISRQKDGRHPDAKGGAAWAEAVWQWLLAERDPAGGSYWALKPAAAGEHGPSPAPSASSPSP